MKHPKNERGKAPGFTLTEMLVAILFVGPELHGTAELSQPSEPNPAK